MYETRENKSNYGKVFQHVEVICNYKFYIPDFHMENLSYSLDKINIILF